MRRVEVEYRNCRGLVAVEAIGSFEIATSGAALRILELEVPVDDDRLAEVLLGPIAALVLAEKSIYLLHASAFAEGAHVGAFVGESGAGKSTLARPEDEVWLRIADDCLPIALLEGQAVALPRFPQLKLVPGRACVPIPPTSCLLGGIFELERSEPADVPIRFERRSPAASALALARNTVAARLFHSERLALHLDACAAMASHVPVERLVYPSGLERLRQVRRAVLERFRVSIAPAEA